MHIVLYKMYLLYKLFIVFYKMYLLHLFCSVAYLAFWKLLTLKMDFRECFIIISAVKRLITSKIKVFVYIIYVCVVCTVYIYCVYINTN